MDLQKLLKKSEQAVEQLKQAGAPESAIDLQLKEIEALKWAIKNNKSYLDVTKKVGVQK